MKKYLLIIVLKKEKLKVNNMSKESVFNKLNSVNVNRHTEKKQSLTYLSWTYAWSEVKKLYPDASYQVWKDEQGNPYTFKESLGYMCYTSVCIEGETLEMWLPVMNGANKAMLDKEYTYKVKDWTASKKQSKDVYIDKIVEPATMFDINKTIMRCLVKNLAMFGLGLYIYSGEDLPEGKPLLTDAQFDKAFERIEKGELELVMKLVDKFDLTMDQLTKLNSIKQEQNESN